MLIQRSIKAWTFIILYAKLWERECDNLRHSFGDGVEVYDYYIIRKIMSKTKPKNEQVHIHCDGERWWRWKRYEKRRKCLGFNFLVCWLWGSTIDHSNHLYTHTSAFSLFQLATFDISWYLLFIHILDQWDEEMMIH